MYGLLKVLCIHNGAYFTRRIGGPIGRDDLHLRLASVHSLVVVWKYIIINFSLNKYSMNCSPSRILSSIRKRIRIRFIRIPIRLSFVAQLAKVTFASFLSMWFRAAIIIRHQGRKCAWWYEYIGIINESTLAFLRLWLWSARLQIHFKVTIHSSHQCLVVVDETFNFITAKRRLMAKCG